MLISGFAFTILSSTITPPLLITSLTSFPSRLIVKSLASQFPNCYRNLDGRTKSLHEKYHWIQYVAFLVTILSCTLFFSLCLVTSISLGCYRGLITEIMLPEKEQNQSRLSQDSTASADFLNPASQ